MAGQDPPRGGTAIVAGRRRIARRPAVAGPPAQASRAPHRTRAPYRTPTDDVRSARAVGRARESPHGAQPICEIRPARVCLRPSSQTLERAVRATLVRVALLASLVVSAAPAAAQRTGPCPSAAFSGPRTLAEPIDCLFSPNGELRAALYAATVFDPTAASSTARRSTASRAFQNRRRPRSTGGRSSLPATRPPRPPRRARPQTFASPAARTTTSTG
jgi:hypothetical protein